MAKEWGRVKEAWGRCFLLAQGKAAAKFELKTQQGKADTLELTKRKLKTQVTVQAARDSRTQQERDGAVAAPWS